MILERNRRMVMLDVLRCVAVLLVLGRHQILPTDIGSEVPVGFLKILYLHGWVGVDLFFTLSGFLIGRLLFMEMCATGRLDIKRFIVRRGFKIWPSLYVYLLLTVMLVVAFDMGRDGLSASSIMVAYLPAFIHIQNYIPVLPAFSGANSTHLWSLAVEEHFYLLLPLFLGFVGRSRIYNARPIRFIGMMAAMLAVLCLCLRWLTYVLTSGEAPSLTYLPTHARIDSLFFGVALGAVVVYASDSIKKWSRHRVFLLGSSLLLFSLQSSWTRESFFGQTIGYTVLMVASGLLVIWGWLREVDPMRKLSPMNLWVLTPMAWVGRYSFSIYIWHLPYAQSVSKKVYSHTSGHTWAHALSFAVFVAVAIGFGWLMGKLVELPMLKMRDRFAPVSPDASAAAETRLSSG